MKQKIILSCILHAWVFAAFMVISSITGCNVNKHITNTSTDSVTVKKVDSTSSQLSDLSKSEGSTSTDSNSVEVDFYDVVGKDSNTYTPSWAHGGCRDTLHPSVVINPTKDGGYMVTNNSPNKIKSIKIKDAKILETHKTTDSVISKTETVNTSDSTHLNKEVKTKDVVKRSGWSILDWIGLIVVGIAILWIAGAIYLNANPLAYILGFVRRKREEV